MDHFFFMLGGVVVLKQESIYPTELEAQKSLQYH